MEQRRRVRATSHVYYKFFSNLNYDAATFNGPQISLRELKCQIMARKKLKATNCDLQVTNAQTKEEYTDDNALIPRNASVIVRRIPAARVKATSKTYLMTPKSHNIQQRTFRSQAEPVSGTSKTIDDSSTPISPAQLIKASNLAETNASEEEKIKAVMTQSCQDYDPVNFVKKNLGTLPPSYTCFRCGKPGHYIKNCPTNRDKNFESVPRIKKSTGIPRSFLMEVKDPNTKGAMLTNTGRYAIPTINAEAYARGKKEKPPFLPAEPPSSSDDDPVPDEFLCLICKDVMTDAVVIPCCGNSYCDESLSLIQNYVASSGDLLWSATNGWAFNPHSSPQETWLKPPELEPGIRTALLESKEHTCPMCHQADVSPDTLVANKILRQVVNNFRNRTGYSKQIQQQQLPPPLMGQTITRNLQPLLRPAVSKQKDPRLIPSASRSSHSAASSSLGRTQAAGAAELPGILPSAAVSDAPPAASLPLRCEKPDGPLREADVVIPPAALATAPELSKSSSPTISSLLEEQAYQVPVRRQPALTSLLGSQGQSIPTNGQQMRASTMCSARGRLGWELEKKKSKLDEFTNDFAKELMEYKRIQKEHRRLSSRSRSPHDASSYSRSSCTYSKSRSGSSRSRTYSQSFSYSQSRSYSRSPSHLRRGKVNSRDHRSSSRSHRHYRSRSRSCRRCPSRSRSPVHRGQSHTKRTIPQGEGEKECFNRHAEVPAHYMKGYYGRPVDFRDPFEKERYREWERNYRERYRKFYKGCAVGAQPPPAVNRKNFAPERFGPPGTRPENSPYAWGNREDHPGGQGNRSHNITGNYGEKPSGRERRGISDPRKSKEEKYPWRDDKGNKRKRHQKRRKCNENEGFPSAELLEGARKPSEPVTAGDDKTDSLFMLPSRDDATPVRDEPMEADLIAFKPVSEKERTEKDKPKEKNDKTKWKVEVAVPPKKDDIITPAKTSQETVGTDSENSPKMEPPAKKVKKELSKTDNAIISSSQKDEKAPGTPWKFHPKVTKDHPGNRTATDEKVKKDHPKETKSEKPSTEDKSEKTAEKSKTSVAKPEKSKGKVDEKVDKEHEATSTDASKPETAEWKTSPKGMIEPDAEKRELTPEKDESEFLNHPAKKIKLSQEAGKEIVSEENVAPAKEPVEKPKASSNKAKQEKAKGKVQKKVTAADGSSSVLVDYTSSSTEGRPIKKTEEKPDTNQTVIKTMEECNNDITAPVEDVLLIMQVFQSDKNEFEFEEEYIKSTQVPTNVGKPASVIKNVSAMPPKPVKPKKKEMEPLEEIQKSTKEVNYESSQRDAKSSKPFMSNEKGKNKDRDHSVSDKDTSEKSSVQREKDHSECATERGNRRDIFQSSKDSRSSEKHDIGPGSTAKDFAPNQVKKSDYNANRDHSSSKCRDEKSEFARLKDSPSGNRESTSVQKSKPRDEPGESSEKGTGDAKRSSYSPPHQWKQSDCKAAPDYKCTLEQDNPLAKNAEKEKHVPEIKSEKEEEPSGNIPPLREESLDVKNENVTSQNDPSVVKPSPQVSSYSPFFFDIAQETDEAAFVPDYNESDSESSGSATDEKASGQNPKELSEKTTDKVKEDPAAPTAVGRPEGSTSHGQSRPNVEHKHSQIPSERHTQSHSISASSGMSQDTKEMKTETCKKKKKHKKRKKHKKQKKHMESKMELEKSHKKKKKKFKKGKKKNDRKGKFATTYNDR